MCTSVDAGEVIIILSDDEDEICSDPSVLIVEVEDVKKSGDEDELCSDPSVLIVEVEDVKKSDCVLSPAALDEDLVVTFSRRAEVLPHARYDCPIHTFTATDCMIDTPVAGNQLMCDQCFCYICDKLASSCLMWSQTGVCHCNSHKRSNFWNHLRDCVLLGGLKTFNLTLSEIDAPLRHAETMLQWFRQGLSDRFSSFLKGKIVEFENSRQNVLLYDYLPVYDYVSSFLKEADKQECRAAAIMRLGAAEDFIGHFQVSGTVPLQSPMSNAAKAKLVLLQRVIASVQRQMVMADFTQEFIHKLQDFYKRLCFPAELKNMKNSLCVRPWDDVLLVSVLKGQNVSGVRKDKGKKDVLSEQISVVLLRTELLQRQHRYRELCRYIRVVKTDDIELLQPVQDLIPYFMCMEGDFTSTVHSLFPSVNAPASRFTPDLFLFYLRIFKTATAPKLAVMRPEELCCSDAAWEPIKDAVPLTCAALVKFALRVQRCSSAVFTDSHCWTGLLTVVNTHTALPEPSSEFLQEAKHVVNSILHDQSCTNLLIPGFFQKVYPEQALLLLVTGALGLRICKAPLSPALPVLETFKENTWALAWLWLNLSSNPERLSSFLQEISQETENTTDGEHWLTFLRAIVPTQSSSTEYWDQQASGSPQLFTSEGPVAVSAVVADGSGSPLMCLSNAEFAAPSPPD
ncbi:uncharacterized protein zgc:112980 isoform X1 [Perca fluviatilis]|uniref:uncharacterized protein zgc:112980 isoform X1 n=1 Tax=Perca fluviatilis TaxID=8168 RepID=UPI00196333D8|nr:uncharacterized protein zgc:112980 isoform X1 [Perca fluviatilis]